jgi:hypothetical protein
MGFLAQRLGFKISRGWTLLLLVTAGIVAASYWIGPLRPLPAEIELLAVSDDAVRPVIDARAQVAGDGSAVRYAVPLAVRNVGATSTRVRRLVLSVPARYHVTTPRGRLTGDVTAGVPLRRYVIELGGVRLDPSPNTVRLPGLDTIWLEPDLPSYYCTISDAQIPEFLPAPDYDVGSLSDVRIFYSFAAGQPGERHTGLLTVNVDASLLRPRPAPMPPTFRTVMQEPEAEVPELGVLFHAGTRRAFCGDPEQPVELYTVLWETASGGRFYVVDVNGEPRKHLYDLNGDGVIELETWDADGDGLFEARREARYAVPDFLVPRPPRDPEMLRPDTVPPDPAWVALFHNTASGPWRFAVQRRADSLAAENARMFAAAAAAAAAAADTSAGAAAAPGVGASGGAVPASVAAALDVSDVAPPDEAWLARFHDVAAGPFRFSPRPAAPVVREPQPQPGQPSVPGTQPGAPTFGAPAPGQQAATPPADTAARAEPADTPVARPAPPPRRRQPLGTPVPYPRRDTIPR